MGKSVLLLLAVLLSAPLAAQTYKWVDERGATHYGERPPAGRPARIVDTRPGGTLEAGGLQQKMREREERHVTEAARPAAVQPAAAPARGMDFDTFIRLQAGMSEGELVLRAGKPDHESVENLRHDIVKSYYYYPTVANPYITVVTLRGGRIVGIERTRKIF
jgi:hypothetical protein